MHKTLLQIYCLLICFITTIILLVYSGFILSASIDWKLTTVKHRVSLEHFSTHSNFLAYKAEKDPDKYPIYTAMSEEELEKVKNQERSHRISHIQADAIKDILTYIVWLIVACVCFYIHWGFYKRSFSAPQSV